MTNATAHAIDVQALAVGVPDLIADLRSDHAGETGAIMIYRAILAVARDPELRAFASAHMETEARHLELLEELLPPRQRSRLLPIWRVAGFLTGFFPALFGPRAVFATIDAARPSWTRTTRNRSASSRRRAGQRAPRGPDGVSSRRGPSQGRGTCCDGGRRWAPHPVVDFGPSEPGARQQSRRPGAFDWSDPHGVDTGGTGI